MEHIRLQQSKGGFIPNVTMERYESEKGGHGE